MGSGGTKTIRMSTRLLIALVVVTSACTTSTQLAEPAPSAATSESIPPLNRSPQIEPTAVAPEPASPPVAEPSAVPESPSAVVAPRQPAEPSGDGVQALSNDGRFAYVGVTSRWLDATPCEARPQETLAVVDVDVAESGAGDAAPYGANLVQVGDVWQIFLGTSPSGVIVTSCGSLNDLQTWMQRAEFGPDGRIVQLGEQVALAGDGESSPVVVRLIDGDLVEVQVVVTPDPNDFETWTIERRHVSTVTGETVTVDSYRFDDDEAGLDNEPVQSPDGRFTYRSVEDPNQGLGCEGFGLARALVVEVDGETLPAVGPSLVFSTIDDLHFGPDGYVAWTTRCEGFTTAYVGKVQDDGTIADAHAIDTGEGASDAYLQMNAYRLNQGGDLVAVGVSRSFTSEPGDQGQVVVRRYDLSQDPHFVNTAVPPPNIDPTPLFGALNEDESWHLGDTLQANPRCGASTLYGKSDAGFVRGFAQDAEIDQIVDVDVTETRTLIVEDGDDFRVRTVVLSTSCPADYEGRRVYFGTESGPVHWGLGVSLADLGEVAQVLSVRDRSTPDADFVEATVVEVELLDGTIAEFDLVAAPRS